MPQRTWMYQAPGNLRFGDHPSVLQLQRSGCGNCWKLADCCGNCCWKLLPCWCWVCLGFTDLHMVNLSFLRPTKDPTIPPYSTVWWPSYCDCGKGPWPPCLGSWDMRFMIRFAISSQCNLQVGYEWWMQISRPFKAPQNLKVKRERATPHRITPKEAAPTPKTVTEQRHTQWHGRKAFCEYSPIL